MLSIIIPSYKDPLLHKTIDSLLENVWGNIEIIPVIDGYKLRKPLLKDLRVKPIVLAENVGMRQAINLGVRKSTGEYIMRTDEHCMFCPEYDQRLTAHIEENWIVTPRRYKLDVEKWERTPDKPIDVEKLIIHPTRHKLTSVRWHAREKETKDSPLVETMAMQGSCWVMRRSWWDKVIKRLDSEGYGTHYQDSIEMVFKTWQAGGKLVANKVAWYAHKHRKFKRTHNYKRKWATASFEHALSVWGDYYQNTVLPQWGLV